MQVSEIEKKLKSFVKGVVHTEKEILNFYSVDSSSFRIQPKIVVIPKNLKDVISVVKFAKKNHLPITPRGAGTGLVGSALGTGIIIDLQYLDALEIKKNYVIVGPGLNRGVFEKALSEHGKFFGPNPSVGPYCTLGGMIATNASGSRSLKYGSVIDNLLEVSIVDSDGKLIKLPDDPSKSNFIKKIADSLKLDQYPKVSKNSCGYRLDTVHEKKDAHKVIAGSEGTLGIIVKAKLKIFNTPKKRFLVVIGFESQKSALENCSLILNTKPSALEFIDESTLKNIPYHFRSKPKCLLFVEYDQKIKQSIMNLKKITKGKIELILMDNAEIDKWWKFRDSALYYSLRGISKTEKAPHIIEDGTFPIEKLTRFPFLIKKIKEMVKGRVIVYGHAGNGNLHVRLISKNRNKNLLRKIAHCYFSDIIKHGGSISGEHGDGLARSEFVNMQYGPANFKIFKKLKVEFDPAGIMNPDKIVTTKKQLTKYLQIY